MFQLYVRMWGNRIQRPSFKYVKHSYLARTFTIVYERTSRLSVLFRNHCSILAFVVCCKKKSRLWVVTLEKKNSVGTEIPIFNKQILLFLILTTFAYDSMDVEKHKSYIWLLTAKLSSLKSYNYLSIIHETIMKRCENTYGWKIC